jgi:ribosomal protein L11 methyltransferase
LLRVYLPAGAAGRTALRALRRLLRGIVDRSHIRTRVVSDAGWASAWKLHARPFTVGRILIQPSGAPSAKTHRFGRGHEGVRAVVALDPGMAFGSGDHPSTQLCLLAIDQHLQRGAQMIDLGTGSGILAIAAAWCGARRVLAIDNDPVAVAVARANVRRNGVARRVTVRRGARLRGVGRRADLIVANLTADILPLVVDDVPRCLAPGGRFVASGFGSVRVAGVRRCVEAAGLRVVATRRLRGWCAVHAVARP